MGYLARADALIIQVAEKFAAALLAVVLRWLLRVFMPFGPFRELLAVRIQLANEMAEDVAVTMVDLWVAEEAGINVDDLWPVEEDEDDSLEDVLEELPEPAAAPVVEFAEETVEELAVEKVSAPDESSEDDDFEAWEEEVRDDAVPLKELDRLEVALNTIFTESSSADEVARRIELLATNEPMVAGRNKLRTQLKARGIRRYVRVVQPDACEKCEPLDGKEYPIYRPFRDHARCRCSLRPVIHPGWAEQVRDQAKEKQA